MTVKKIFLMLLIASTAAIIAAAGEQTARQTPPTVNSQWEQKVRDLPELTVNPGKRKIIHILAYVREYSSMASWNDTVFLFREKMVDYMLPANNKVKFKGWLSPRILSSRSYYRFTNSNGLDSVSDVYRLYFSWGDWLRLPPITPLPSKLLIDDQATDTVGGKYQNTLFWRRNGDLITVDADVPADTLSRRWAPGYSHFFDRNIDFRNFTVHYEFGNESDRSVNPRDMTFCSFRIESGDRGRSMFRFNRTNESISITTDAEIYILDKEYITEREARQWEKKEIDENLVGIIESDHAPRLSPEIASLVGRVNAIDKDSVRLQFTPDRKLGGKFVERKHLTVGQVALALLKSLIGLK